MSGLVNAFHKLEKNLISVLCSYKQGSDTLNSDVLADSKITNISEYDGKAVITFGGQKIPVDIVTEQFVPMGPAASQVAIKQTGTNGGGCMGVNSAHPLENPNPFTNILEMICVKNRETQNKIIVDIF